MTGSSKEGHEVPIMCYSKQVLGTIRITSDELFAVLELFVRESVLYTQC